MDRLRKKISRDILEDETLLTQKESGIFTKENLTIVSEGLCMEINMAVEFGDTDKTATVEILEASYNKPKNEINVLALKSDTTPEAQELQLLVLVGKNTPQKRYKSTFSNNCKDGLTTDPIVEAHLIEGDNKLICVSKTNPASDNYIVTLNTLTSDQSKATPENTNKGIVLVGKSPSRWVQAAGGQIVKFNKSRTSMAVSPAKASLNLATESIHVHLISQDRQTVLFNRPPASYTFDGEIVDFEFLENGEHVLLALICTSNRDYWLASACKLEPVFKREQLQVVGREVPVSFGLNSEHGFLFVFLQDEGKRSSIRLRIIRFRLKGKAFQCFPEEGNCCECLLNVPSLSDKRAIIRQRLVKGRVHEFSFLNEPNSIYQFTFFGPTAPEPIHIEKIVIDQEPPHNSLAWTPGKEEPCMVKTNTAKKRLKVVPLSTWGQTN